MNRWASVTAQPEFVQRSGQIVWHDPIGPEVLQNLIGEPCGQANDSPAVLDMPDGIASDDVAGEHGAVDVEALVGLELVVDGKAVTGGARPTEAIGEKRLDQR